MSALWGRRDFSRLPRLAGGLGFFDDAWMLSALLEYSPCELLVTVQDSLRSCLDYLRALQAKRQVLCRGAHYPSLHKHNSAFTRSRISLLNKGPIV
jgi:hypothetical protein